MKKNWFRILPWMALSSGILLIVLLGLATVLKKSKNLESAVNKEIALDKLKQIKVESTADLTSTTFFNYFEKTLNCPAITTKWLASDKGEITYAKGVMAAGTTLKSSIYSIEDAQSRGLIDAVEGNFDTIQKGILFMAAKIRSEGEHNDIYGHLVMPLRTSSDVVVGYAGVAYSLDDSKPALQNYIIDVALIICFLIYWLSLPLWVYLDCRDKNNKYILWSIFVLAGNIPAFIAYLITEKN
jgi:hypothetical protein